MKTVTKQRVGGWAVGLLAGWLAFAPARPANAQVVVYNPYVYHPYVYHPYVAPVYRPYVYRPYVYHPYVYHPYVYRPVVRVW